MAKRNPRKTEIKPATEYEPSPAAMSNEGLESAIANQIKVVEAARQELRLLPWSPACPG